MKMKIVRDGTETRIVEMGTGEQVENVHSIEVEPSGDPTRGIATIVVDVALDPEKKPKDER